jgi:hypothetical protein
MFRNEIVGKTQWICLNCVRFSYGVAGCIGLAHGRAQMYSCEKGGMQVGPHVASLVGTHDGSSRSVAYLKVARLERRLECGRREGETACCFKHTPEDACWRSSFHGARMFAPPQLAVLRFCGEWTRNCRRDIRQSSCDEPRNYDQSLSIIARIQESRMVNFALPCRATCRTARKELLRNL